MSNQEKPQAIYSAILRAMEEIGHISKDKRNQQQGFNYRGIDDVYNAANHAFHKAGIVCVFVRSENLAYREIVTSKGTRLFVASISVTYRLHAAEDGSFVESTIIAEAMDQADKAVAKAYSMAHKYLILQTLMVPTVDMPDPDADSADDDPGYDARIIAKVNEIASTADLQQYFKTLTNAERNLHVAYFTARNKELKNASSQSGEIK